MTIIYFVHKLEGQQLKKLRLDSVSLSAMPRPQGNLGFAAQAHAGVPALVNHNVLGGQALPGLQFPPLNPLGVAGAQPFHNPPNITYPRVPDHIIQCQITAVSAHRLRAARLKASDEVLGALDAQSHQLDMVYQNQRAPWNLGSLSIEPPVFEHHSGLAPYPMTTSSGVQIALHKPPRLGAWPWVIDAISPGLKLQDMGNSLEHVEAADFKRLEGIEFESCGYVFIQNQILDQLHVEVNIPQHPPTSIFASKQEALDNLMMRPTDYWLGSITCWMDPDEVQQLISAWFLKFGWEDKEAAEAATFDGHVPGGTNRFSGHIHRDHRKLE